MKAREIHPDVLVEVLALVKKRLPAGVAVKPEDFQLAYQIVWAQHALETIEWKREHITCF